MAVASGDVNAIVASGSTVGSAGAPVMVTVGAVVSTVQAADAGAPVLPAASVATTEKVCGPSGRPSAVNGDVHAAGVPASRVQVNVAVASGDEKVRVASGSLVGSAGAESMATAGAAVSTVQAADAGGPVLPAASVATTEKVWGPSASPGAVNGELHGPGVPPSRAQANVAVASGDENEIDASGSLVGSGGAASIVTVGAVASRVHAAVAGIGSVTPETMAATATVCGPSTRPAGTNGEVHATGVPLSTAQLNVAPSPAGSVSKLTEAPGSFVGSDGAEVITVSNTVSDCDADEVNSPLVASTVTEDVPVVVGVPVSAPPAPIDVPAGGAPAVTANVAGDMGTTNPPVAGASTASTVGPVHEGAGLDCPALSQPQQWSVPSVRMAQVWDKPAVMVVMVPVPAGMVDWPKPSLPQQVGVPSVRMAHVKKPPAVMVVTVPVPAGTVDWP